MTNQAFVIKLREYDAAHAAGLARVSKAEADMTALETEAHKHGLDVDALIEEARQ